MVFPENYSKIPIVFTNLAPINKLSKDSLILYINFDCKEIYHWNLEKQGQFFL